MDDATGEAVREKGGEFGATTGRPRRCGWLDMVAARYAVRLNGADGLALTKLDVLTGMDPVRVCTAYEIDGKRTEAFPASADAVARARPVYDTFPGWSEDVSQASGVGDLPDTCRAYVEAVGSMAGVPVQMISVGPDRRQCLRAG
jgi:adenylosuccinate synthase